MSSLNRTSTFIESQLPGFIKGNPEYALFVEFLQKYYEYLELPGNPVYELRRAQENYDIDLARKTLLRYFKDKILPSFPEETELSTEKIIKASRDFYAKKGTPDSFKFLFRILYNQEIDVFLPKTNILRASDGKWAVPQAIRISFADRSIKINGNVTVNTVTANSVDFLGDSGVTLTSTGLAANSYIRIGNERRKITTINYGLSKFNVDVRFASTADAVSSGFIYRSGNSIYQLYPSDNATFNFKLLKNKVAVGVNSRTTCIIEDVIKTYDSDSNQEIAELYVSNVNRLFEVGENLEVEYQDEFGVNKIFTTKIISLVSNISLLKDRLSSKPIGGNRYAKGDPVVFYGGLDSTTDLAKKAIAVVNDVSTGGIEEVKINKAGYYFRTSSNGGLIRIQSTTGVGANLLINEIFTDGGISNSAIFSYGTDAIIYKKNIQLDSEDYEFDNVTSLIEFTTGAGNTTTTVNLSTSNYIATSINDYFKSFRLTVVAGTGSTATPNSAIISKYSGLTKRAFLETPLAVAPDGTSKIKITANANTEIGRAFSYETFILGKIKNLDLVNTGTGFADPPKFDFMSTFETDYSSDSAFEFLTNQDFYGYDPDSFPLPSIKLNSSDNDFSLENDFYNGTRLFIDTGDVSHFATVVDYVVTDNNTPANVKTLFLDRKFENNITPQNINRYNLYFDYRADVRNVGKIGGIEVISGGTGYNARDIITFVGNGYGAKANVVVDASGRIVDVRVVDHGEGYYGQVDAIVNSTSGTGASLYVWGLSDGEAITSTQSDDGRIKTFKILNRGFGYANTPNVSLKVVDVFSAGPGNLSSIIMSGDQVWQGNTNIAAPDVVFTAKVDDVYDISNSANSIIRLYNYNGSLNNTPLYANTKTGNIIFSNTVHVGTYSFKEIYDKIERTYPYYYGDGLAKARAEFLNGLIKYQGYYLNTDGFPSADQKLQDNRYYHNYSYEIQSEKSLTDYRSTVYEVIHPAGTHLLGKYLFKDTIDVNKNPTPGVVSSNLLGGTISTSSGIYELTGAGAATLAATANVGDIIVINTSADTERQHVRTIVELDPDIRIDSPVGRPGDGILKFINESSVGKCIGNTFPITDTLRVGDSIYLFTLQGPYLAIVTNISANNVTINTPFPVVSQNVSYQILATLNNVPYRLIKQIG